MRKVLLLLVALSFATPAFAAAGTARTSGALTVYAYPGERVASTPGAAIDRLDKREEVYVDQCTRRANWCRIATRRRTVRLGARLLPRRRGRQERRDAVRVLVRPARSDPF